MLGSPRDFLSYGLGGVADPALVVLRKAVVDGLLAGDVRKPVAVPHATDVIPLHAPHGGGVLQ